MNCCSAPQPGKRPNGSLESNGSQDCYEWCEGHDPTIPSLEAQADSEEEEKRKAAIEATKLEMEKTEAARKAAEEKAVQGFRQTLQEQKEAKEKAVFEYQKSEAERQAELEAKKKAWEAEQLDKRQKGEEKEKQAKQKWENEREKKRLEEEEKEKKSKEKVKEKERLDLLGAGFSPQQVDAIIDPKLAPRVYPGVIPESEYEYIPYTYTNDEYTRTKSKYFKVHRDHICVETLTHYHIPWKYDEVRPSL